MIEDASNLISKRSLHWDLSGVYPGLVMRIGPTLANGVLEFVMDPRMKDRAYQHQSHGEMSTGKNCVRFSIQNTPVVVCYRVLSTS